MSYLFPPSFTCNNHAFNEGKTSKKPPANESDLRVNICITTNMTARTLEETLTALADDCGNSDMDVEAESDDYARDRKRTKTVALKTSSGWQLALKKLKAFVANEVDFCVYAVFQMAIDSDEKRHLLTDDEVADDVTDVFSNLYLG